MFKLFAEYRGHNIKDFISTVANHKLNKSTTAHSIIWIMVRIVYREIWFMTLWQIRDLKTYFCPPSLWFFFGCVFVSFCRECSEGFCVIRCRRERTSSSRPNEWVTFKKWVWILGLRRRTAGCCWGKTLRWILQTLINYFYQTAARLWIAVV